MPRIGFLLYSAVLIGTLSVIIVLVNRDLGSTRGVLSTFRGGHDGTPKGRLRHYVDSKLKGWSHAFPGENLPEPIQIAWQSVKDNALYVFRGILLASIYLSLALSEALRLGFVDDLSGGSAQGVVRFAIFNASVLAFLIVLSMVGVTYFGRRKSRKEKKQASDSSSFPSESIYSSSLGELSIFKQTGQPEEFLNESTSQMVSTESSEKGSTKNSEKRSHKSNEKSGSISNSPASTELPREATPSSNESSKRKKTIKEDEEQEEDGDKEDEQDGNEEPEEQSAQVSKSKKRGNGSKSGSDSKSGSGSKNRNKSNSESGGGSHFQSAKGSQGDEDLDKLENNGNDSVYETETATQTRKSTGSQNRKSQKASGSGSITKTDSGSGSKTKAGSGSGSKTKIGSGSKRDQDLSGSEKSYDEEPADSEASKNQTGPVSQESNKRSGSCSKGSRKRRRSGSRSSRSRTPTVSGSKNESTQDSNCTKCTEIERKKKEQESKAAGRGQTMPQNELSGQRESKPNIFEHYNQKPGKTVDLYDNQDNKTEAILAYIADCEAYDEEDLKRQNEQLRRQVAQGVDADISASREEQIQKLTQGMIKMLKQVRKESQFSNYAYETLQNEKRALNEELHKLLALPPQELAQMDLSSMFKDLRNKVQKKSAA